MPPRFVYWTILIDGQPTAFRARDREELLPTVNQLKRKNQDVAVKWFARGKLWDSPEAEYAAQFAPVVPREKRPRDWRPGGQHKDPRDRFKKKNRPERAWSESDRDRDRPPRRDVERKPWENTPRAPHADRPRREGDRKPWENKPRAPQGDRKPWNKPSGPPRDRPWQTKPTGPRAQRTPWNPKMSGPPSRGPNDRPAGKGGPARQGPKDRPAGDRGWQSRPTGRPPFRPNRPPFKRKKRDDDPDKK